MAYSNLGTCFAKQVPRLLSSIEDLHMLQVVAETGSKDVLEL
jgi:hypothetical protein